MGSFSLCLLLSTLAVVASYVLLPRNHPPEVIHVGDGKTRQFTNTVTTDGKTRFQTVSYTDNSVVANGIIHSGQGTINIAQENIPNQKQWRSSEPKDLNSRTGVKGKRDTLAVTYKDQSTYVHSAQIDGSGVINIGNGRRSKRSDDAQLRYKRKGGFWDIGVDTNTDFSRTDDTWKNQPVVANNNYLIGSGGIIIGNGDRSKRSTENLRQKRAFDGSLAIHDMRTKPGPPVNIENIYGRGSAHIVIDDNTDPITLEGAKIHGSAMINIGG